MHNAADLYTEKEKDLHIYTVKGRQFFASKPTFDIEEIAHALSMQCRFTGHVREFYSVAEHCVLVSKLCAIQPECGSFSPLLAFEGLMHDAHEAYISDLAAPWKVLAPDYRKVEEAFELALRRHYGLSDKIHPAVKQADWYALFLEADQLLPKGTTENWLTPTEEFREQYAQLELSRYQVRCLDPKHARRMFLETFAMSRAFHTPRPENHNEFAPRHG